MTFEILQARSAEDEPSLLYPTPGPSPDSFLLEPGDGDNPFGYDCLGALVTQLERGSGSTELGRVEHIKGALTITDTRLVFSCTQFDTGGGFMGGGTAGVLIAAAANAASKAIATRKTRGYTLVGHVRFEWLGAISAVDRRWGRTQNYLKLTFEDPTPDGHIAVLTLFPPNNQPASQIGLEMARRAARHRAQHRSGAAKAELEAWAAHPMSTPTSKGNGRAWIVPD